MSHQREESTCALRAGTPEWLLIALWQTPSSDVDLGYAIVRQGRRFTADCGLGEGCKR